MSKTALFSLFLIVFVIFACKKDDEVSNLAGAAVHLQSPPAVGNLTDTVVNFSWLAVEGATSYEFQLASPTFNILNHVVLKDTMLEDLGLVCTLSPGNYTWRIRAWSGNSYTSWYARTFEIDPGADLSTTSVVLDYPYNPTYLNTIDSITFNWRPVKLGEVDYYKFRITRPDEYTLLGVQIFTADTFVTVSSEYFPEGVHAWGVEAQNDYSTSQLSTSLLWIDLTNPPSPTLTSPADNATVSAGSILFDWSRPQDVGTFPSAVSDSIYFHTDMLAPPVAAYGVNGQQHQETLGANTWYWRVKSTDRAENQSPFSNWNTLVVQ